MNISVITPTVRIKGLGFVKDSLARQTFKDFEWLISSSPSTIPILEEVFGGKADYADKFPMRVVVEPDKTGFKNEVRIYKDPPKPKDFYYSLGRAHNQMIREAKGDLIVSVQDYTTFEPNGLEKFWYYFTNGYDRACISGVGDKYDDEEMRHKVWSDPRIRRDFGTFYECFPRDIEFNYAAFPRKAFFEVGGFDEELDRFAAMGHISVQERLDELGYKFYLDQTNITKSLIHDRLPNWDERHAMHGGYERRKEELKEAGIWPKLSYLDKNS